MREFGYRILADGETRDNNTWNTGLNNNDLIIGPSGAGKTRHYIKPNLLQCQESVVVTDTKGALLDEVGPDLAARGYRVLSIDFAELDGEGLGACGYNPLDYVRYNQATGRWSEQDIMSIACALVPQECAKDPFWDNAAQMYMACMIGYVLECLPPEEHTLRYVMKLFAQMNYDRSGNASFEEGSPFGRLLCELGRQNPDSIAWRKFCEFRGNAKVEKMHESIRGILAAKLAILNFDAAQALYARKSRVDFASLGRKRTALFLTVSDTDRSMDKLVNLFYTQAFHALCRSADRDYADHRLPVPVRFMLDDFAAGTVIPHFDNLTSVIRSREISVSIVIQSLTQLEGLYGRNAAMTIINNCDNCLYLGGQDTHTAQFMAEKVNKPASTILNLPLGSAYLFTRGRQAKAVKKYDLRGHARYSLLTEAARERQTEVEYPGF